MYQISQLYHGIETFKEFISENKFNPTQDCLVRLFTDCLGKEELATAISSIRGILPNATVVGGTSSGAIIFQSEQYEQETVVVINTFDRIKVRPFIFDWENMTPSQVLKTLKSKYGKNPNKNQVNIVFSNTCGRLYDILDDFVHFSNNTHPFINFVGGVAGNIQDQNQVKSYVFYNDEILENGVVAFSLEATNNIDPINFLTFTSIAADEISDYHQVTKVEGNKIHEIDNVPATKWFYDFLNVAHDEKLTYDEFLKVAGNVHFSGFSIISNKHQDTSRCVIYDDENYVISLFSSKMSVGSKFKVGYLNPRRVLNESFILAGKICRESVQSLFVYSCSARKTFLKSAAKLELRPLAANDVSGIFCLGEICNQDGKNNLYNASCCVIGFSEALNHHLPVDTSMLTVKNIQSDMRFYSKAAYQYQKIVDTHEEANSVKFIDYDYNLPNILKYNYDIQYGIFDKICVAEVVTGDATISAVGKDVFIDSGREMFASMGKFIDALGFSEYIRYYILSYKSIVLTCSTIVEDDDFIEFMRKFYDRFGYVTSQTNNISAVVRFVLVLNQEDMLKVGTSTLYAHRSSQENFIICDNEDNNENEIFSSETFYINLLKKAIEHDLITPYFQGLYNNKTGKIDKYEALMRIVDQEKVYAPYAFMDVAKKFKLYSEISKRMISKSLDHFENTDGTVSINVSLYDVESNSFREWLIGRLKTIKHPENIIIELVESEECHDMNLLKEFIKEVRECGSLIAIDDFGSGYSSFATIANLSPDLLKIDGSIIKGIVENPVNLKIMKTICYLAESLNIKTVAEFVDSQEIQDILVENGVHHSQGYFFSVPSPTTNTPEHQPN